MEMGSLVGKEMSGKESNNVKMKSIRRNVGSRQSCFFMQGSDPSGWLEEAAGSPWQDTEAATCPPLPAGLGALPARGSKV